MAKLSIKPDSTSVSLLLFVQDSASTTGGGKTGLAYNTASLTCYYVRPGAAAAAISLVTQTVTGAWSSGGFVEVDSTNMPGVYRFDVPNAVLAAGVRSAVVMLKGASGMVPLVLEVDLNAEVNVVYWLGAAAPANTGDAYARLGAAGAGLTALGDARLANLDAAVSTRSTYAGGAVASVTGAVGSVTAPVTAGTVSDKTGYALSSAGVQAIWDALTSALTTAGSVGKRIADYLDAAVSSRGTSTYAGGDTSGVTTLLGRIIGTLATGLHNPQTGDAYGRLTGTVEPAIADVPTNAELATALGTADDATLAAIAALNNLSSAQAQSAAAAALTAYDPPTNAELEARTLLAANYATAAALTAVDDYVDTEVAAIKAVTDKIDTALELDGAVYRYTANALEQAPAGGGAVADWTATEREQLRYRLGIDGSTDAPIANPTFTVTGGTINSVSGTVTLADDGITAAKLSDSAIAEIAAAAAGGATMQQMRDAMLLAPTAGTPAAGSIDDHLDDLATALAAATSTLTVVSAVDGDVLTIYQAVSFQATISGLAIPAAWTKVWLTVKQDSSQADTEAIIQMVESNPGAGTDGLLRLNGAAGTAANGTLTVSQAAGTVVIDLVDESTDDLALATGLIWSLKALASSGATTLLAVGTLNVRGQATAAVA